MEKLTILQVIPDLNSGGVEAETLEVAKYLKKKSNNSMVCSNGGALVSHLKELGIKHIKLPVHTKNPIKMMINAYRLSKLVKEHNVDILHARSRAPAWSAWMASLISKAHFVTTFHAAYSASHPMKRFYNSVMLKGERVISISDFIKKHIETRYHFTSDELVVINRGVDIHEFDRESVSADRIKKLSKSLGLDLKKGEKLIVLPSRFTRIKGHIFLIKALHYMMNKNFKCLMVGKVTDAQSEYVRDIEDAIKEYKMDSRVILCKEPITDMPALYCLADVVVSSSLEPEGFGRTVIEAQAMQTIIVSTNIGAPKDIIEDGKSGFLAPSHDHTTFAEILDKAISLSDAKRNAILKHAHHIVSTKYSLDNMCKSTLALYKELISEDDE